MSAKRAEPQRAAKATTPGAVARILGEPVPPCFPEAGPVRVLCIGEAPGPRGADKSGVPFFGDRAGAPLYRALVAAGGCTLPEAGASLSWDGAAFASQSLRPAMRGVALGNAYDRCPTNDGQRFRAPSRAELESDENIARLAHDIERASARGLRRIVALGRVASLTVVMVMHAHPDRWSHVTLTTVPHPSAQGLLSAAPDRGRGLRLADLAAAWEAELAAVIRADLETA
jgi:uracil-DNA glycosylase